MSPPGPKELAQRALGENKRAHRRTQPKPVPYAGKPAQPGLHSPMAAKVGRKTKEKPT